MFLRASDKSKYTITKSDHFEFVYISQKILSGMFFCVMMFKFNNKSAKAKQKNYTNLCSLEQPFAFDVA